MSVRRRSLEDLQASTRRHFLAQSSLGLGALALATLSGRSDLRASSRRDGRPLDPKQPHHEARAKRVIYIHLTGRSEEHTSELQSRENLVCRLLLEKKK